MEKPTRITLRRKQRPRKMNVTGESGFAKRTRTGCFFALVPDDIIIKPADKGGAVVV